MPAAVKADTKSLEKMFSVLLRDVITQKLKEFQGKHRESEFLKQSNLGGMFVKSHQDSSHQSVQTSSGCTPLIDENKKVEYGQNSGIQNYVGELTDQKIHSEEPGDDLKSLNSSFMQSNSFIPLSEGNQISTSNKNFTETDFALINKNNQMKSKSEDPATSLTSNECNEPSLTGFKFNNGSKSLVVDDKSDYQSSNIKCSTDAFKDITSTVSTEKEFQDNNLPSYNSVIFNESKSLFPNDQREFSNSHITFDNALNEIIKPLETELQNHAETINILVQQRNDAQNALAHAQNLLCEKSDELLQQKQQIINLNLAVTDLNKRLSESESVARKLSSENEKKIQEINDAFSSCHALKAQFDAKEEEHSELKKKYEHKSKECQHLVFSLNEAQNQLSLYQIQMSPVTDEKSSSTISLSALQNENINLSQENENLKKQLEAANAEKEQSNQNFMVYAQQCNAELHTLNSQLKDLIAENQKLKQINDMPSNLSEVQDSKEEDLNSKNYKTEIADLHSQISVLTEKKNEIEENCQKLQEEISFLKNELREKDVEIQNKMILFKEVEAENKKLLIEVETPKPNERLLATIESDKVAAAKAVSQNQKLKSQVMELEEAFVKLSEEKLELTDKLSHERYINKELQNQLENLDPLHHHHPPHHDQDQLCHSSHNQAFCSAEVDKTSISEIDRQKIEELQKIICQLQDDKMELKSRLNLLMSEIDSNKRDNILENSSTNSEEDIEKNEDEKFHLQLMEEKVRKTMNEIAVLDEEKEKLEHLVLQLQGETETIGEYITLYQRQRMLLKQRAQEKDNQLLQLSKDKEELKSKLFALDELVQQLLREKNNGNSASDTNSLYTLETKFSENTYSENTVGKIRDLINEIGSTGLVSSHSVAFKHCSCCSGRLITI